MDLIGHALTLIIDVVIVILVFAMVLYIFVTTYCAWFYPKKLRTLEAKRIQYWPMLGGQRVKEWRYSEIQTETWLKTSRATLTLATIVLFVFLAVILRQAFVSLK